MPFLYNPQSSRPAKLALLPEGEEVVVRLEGHRAGALHTWLFLVPLPRREARVRRAWEALRAYGDWTPDWGNPE